MSIGFSESGVTPVSVVRSRGVPSLEFANALLLPIAGSIGGMAFSRSLEVVRFSECPLLEVSLYV